MSAGRYRMSCRYCGSAGVHWYRHPTVPGQTPKFDLMNTDGSKHDCPEKRANDALRAEIRARNPQPGKRRRG